MKALVLGVQRMAGVAKETRRPYDMIRFRICTTSEDFENEDMKRISRGMEVAEVDAVEEAFEQALSLKYPCFVDLQMDQRLRGRKLETVVVALDLSTVKPLV